MKLRNWRDSLDKRPKLKKMDMRFGTWNVRSMYRAGSLRAVVEEISKDHWEDQNLGGWTILKLILER
jgi:hypothetical protein